jgi:hypothetical protein
MPLSSGEVYGKPNEVATPVELELDDELLLAIGIRGCRTCDGNKRSMMSSGIPKNIP